MSGLIPAPKLQVALYRGHTHGEFCLMPNAPVGGQVGRWVRENLTDKEYVPKGWRWDPIQKMRVFNPYAYWKAKTTFANYDYKSSRLHVPIAFCDDIKKVIEEWGGEVAELVVPGYPLRKIDAKMNPKFTDRPWQTPLITKCSDPTPGMKGLEMQTGKGKTYSAVKSAVNLGYATVVIVPGLVGQWIEAIREQTNLKVGKNIYKLEGFDSFAQLAKYPNFKPEFFVASTRTMQMFCNKDPGYELLPWDFAGFFRAYGIGTKIIDECHKQFHATTMMDLAVNVPYNLYCSATFDQTSRFAKKIFDRVYPVNIRYGAEAYDKYVTVYWLNFNGEVDERKACKAGRYMHALYEKELLKSKFKLEDHIRTNIQPAINQFFVNTYKKGNKCLLFCSSIEYVENVVKYLKLNYPKFKVSEYIGASDRSVLDKADILVSTIGKASTGLDLKGLVCCINTVSVRTSVLTAQMLGRLRKINGTELVYVDMCDVNCQSHLRHAETRKSDLTSMAAKFYECYGWHDSNVQQLITLPAA